VTSFINIKCGDVAGVVVPSGMQKLVDRQDKMFERTWTIC